MFDFLKRMVSCFGGKKAVPLAPVENGKNLLAMIVNPETGFNVDCIDYYFMKRDVTLKPEDTQILFISTPDLEKKEYRRSVMKSVKIDMPDQSCLLSYEHIVVNDMNYEDIKNKLDGHLNAKEYDNIFVNVSSDSESFSIYVYDYFKQKYYGKKWMNIFCYRLSNDKELKHILPIYPLELFDSQELVSFERILKSFFKGDNVLAKYPSKSCVFSEDMLVSKLSYICSKANTRINLNSVVSELYNLVRKGDRLKRLDWSFVDFDEMEFDFLDSKCKGREQAEIKSVDPKAVGEIKEYLKELGLAGKISYNSMFFAANGWFEELVYHLNAHRYGLHGDKIMRSIKITKFDSSDELDVVFVDPNSNRLNVVECKDSIDYKVLDEAVIDQIARREKFGDSVIFSVWTTGSKKDIPVQVTGRAEGSSIKIVAGEDIQDMLEAEYGSNLNGANIVKYKPYYPSYAGKNTVVPTAVSANVSNVDLSTIYVFKATEAGHNGNLKGCLIPDGDVSKLRGIYRATMSNKFLIKNSIEAYTAVGKEFKVRLRELNPQHDAWIISEIIGEADCTDEMKDFKNLPSREHF